jgi:hypothetical protein
VHAAASPKFQTFLAPPQRHTVKVCYLFFSPYGAWTGGTAADAQDVDAFAQITRPGAAVAPLGPLGRAIVHHAP